MRWLVTMFALVPVLALAGEGVESRLCAAAVNDGALAIEVEALMDQGTFPFVRAEDMLTMNCAGESLLQRIILASQAENLEYAVIDMGANVNAPLITQEGGKLSLAQYLMQQAVLAPSAEARAFAMDYMQELRDTDFNPLLSITMN